MCLVGSYVGLSKILVLHFPVFLLALLRFAIGSLALIPWLRASPEVPRGARGYLVAMSFVGFFLFSVFALLGAQRAKAIDSGVVMAGIPACCAVLSALFLKEKVGPRTVVALVLAVAGIAGVAMVKPNDAPSGAPPLPSSERLLGILFLFLAVLCEAGYVVLARLLSSGAHTLPAKTITSHVTLYGLLFALPAGLLQGFFRSFSPSDPPLSAWAGLVAYSLASSVVCVWLWMRGMAEVPASRAGLFTVCLPITSALVGVLFLGESLSLPQALAFLAALAGLVIETWPK